VKRLGRSTQGVIVMRLREGEQVVALAPVVEGDEDDELGAEGTDLVAADGAGELADAEDVEDVEADAEVEVEPADEEDAD